MKKIFKITFIVAFLLIVCLFINSKVFATVRVDEIGEDDNTGIVINGTTIIENGEIVENIQNISYDKESNILTLNNCTVTSLRIVGMGSDFKIKVIGNNSIKGDSLFGGPRAGEGEIMYSNIQFIGNGILDIETIHATCTGTFKVNGPTIKIKGSMDADTLSVEKGSLSVTKSGDFMDRAVLLYEDFEVGDNIVFSDNEDKPIYLVSDVSSESKTFCYTENFESNKIVENIVIKEKEALPVIEEEKSTGIKFEANTDSVPENTKLVVNEINNGEVYNTVETVLKDTVGNMKIFDISLESDNVKIQPNGKVKISIPIPDGFDTTNLRIYRISEDGTKTEYNVTVENNYATFETDHFSTYVLAETKKETKTETKVENNEKQLDSTPKTGYVDNIVIISLVALVSFAGIVIFKR